MVVLPATVPVRQPLLTAEQCTHHPPITRLAVAAVRFCKLLGWVPREIGAHDYTWVLKMVQQEKHLQAWKDDNTISTCSCAAKE